MTSNIAEPGILRISASTTPFLYDPHEAVSLIRDIRWQGTLRCPRCGSTNVRVVQTTRAVEVLSCRGCRLNFTSSADTYFHGSRIPVFEQLRFILVVALEPGSSASRLSRFLGWQISTITRQLRKLSAEMRSGGFVLRGDNYKTFESFSSVDEFLEQPAISIRKSALEERLRLLLASRGKGLRRSNTAKPLTKEHEKSSSSGMSAQLPNLVLISPECLDYLYDGSAAYEVVSSLRWNNYSRACPRCSSRIVLPAKGQRKHSYRCVDCRYQFNILSGTIFKNTLLPINKHFQVFILDNALGKALRLSDLCVVLECNFRTARRHLALSRLVPSTEQFAFVGVEANTFSLSDRLKPVTANDAFLSFCRVRKIVLNEERFLNHVKRVSSAKIHIGSSVLAT